MTAHHIQLYPMPCCFEPLLQNKLLGVAEGQGGASRIALRRFSCKHADNQIVEGHVAQNDCHLSKHHSTHTMTGYLVFLGKGMQQKALDASGRACDVIVSAQELQKPAYVLLSSPAKVLTV